MTSVTRGTPSDATSRIPDVVAAWLRLYTGHAADAGIPTTLALPRGERTHRSVVDSTAAWMRWHDPTAAIPFRAESEVAFAAYVAAERARVEALSARQLRGMARNLMVQPSLLPRGPRFAELYQDVRTAIETRASDGALEGLDPHRFALQWRDAILAAAREYEEAPTTEHAEEVVGAPSAGPRDAPAGDPSLDAPQRVEAADGSPDGSGDEEGEPAGADPDDQPPTNLDAKSAQTEWAERWFSEYRVFSRAWDQEVDAAALLATPEGASDADLSLHEDSQLWRHAVEFKRRILAAHDWRWHFDRPEGQIDPRRLARLVAGRPPFEIFRAREFMGEMAAVTFLVDQSGSMKGEPQRLTVLTVDLATRVLESLGIPCEVLGYTTRFGGSSRQSGARNPVLDAWRAAGSPPQPGRLNAVRHIVIKRFDQPYRQARNNLRVLVAPALGRENIDGEALHWAGRRLASRPEPRKVLLVLSDATPLDPATQQANAPLFLEGHLRSVIAAIEHSQVRLGAIGIGTRLEAFYRRALTVPRPEDIDRLIFGFLGDLLN